MDPSKGGFMNFLNQGSSSQHSSQNSPSTQFLSTFFKSQFPKSPQFTQASPPNFQTFHPFGPPVNYHLYSSSPPNFQGFQQQASWLQSAPISFQEVVLKSTEETTKSVEAKKEQTRMEKYHTYLKLLEKDTANFSDAKLKRHEAVLKRLATELAEEQMIPNLCLYP
uniref:Uncharacterized protein n=1 Tax=Oryza nivara TaxID=4536 RepID=A0A0E0IIE1_ORYNI